MAEPIPARGAQLVVAPLRHNVMVPQQDAVERLGGGGKIIIALGEDDMLDHRVDRRVFDADHVIRACLVGRLRAKVIAQLVAGQLRLPPGEGDDVEIPVAQPVLILRRIDRAYRHGDAEAFERGLVEQEDALEVRVYGEEFDRVTLARLAVDELQIAHFVARFLEEPHRLAQIGAHRGGIAADRIGIRFLEHLGGNLVAHRLQEFELAAGRQAGGREVRAFEIAGDAFVLAEEDLLVHLLEIERVIEGKPHARIMEFLAPDIEGEGLHHADVFDGKFLEDDEPVGDRREVVGGGPVLGAVLDAPVDRVGLERLQRDGAVAEIFEPQLVEIVAADVDVDGLAPIVLHALVDDAAAGRELLDAVGAASRAAAPAWSSRGRVSCRPCRSLPTTPSARW